MRRWVYKRVKLLGHSINKQQPSSVEVKLLPNCILQSDV